MRVLVTGGAGFIGSALVRYLVGEKHYEVLNVDKLTYAGNLASLATVQHLPNYRFLKADIADQKAMEEAFQTFRPDRVMHLAAESHVDRSIDDARDFLHTNVLGTHVILSVAQRYHAGLSPDERQNFRVLHVSTDEVYGSLGEHGRFTEETRYDPSSPYSATKAASDHLAKAWARTYGLPVVVSNCSNNYGPYHFPEKLIPLMILNAMGSRSLPVYGNGQNVRDWLFVDDHVRALDHVVERGRLGETYNIGGTSERSNLEVVHGICDILDELKPHERSHRELITHVADRPGHDFRYAIDSTKLETELGWQVQESFDSGLRKTVDWYLNNSWWWKPLKERYDAARLGLTPGPSAMVR